MKSLWILLLATPALATDKPVPPLPQEQVQAQSQKQGQQQGQGQQQSAESYAESTSSNSQSVTFTSPDDIKFRNVASPGTPNIYPTGPCLGGWSAGLSVAGFAGSGGRAVLDEECADRETARMFYEFGERDKAIMLLCMTPSGQKLPDCKPAQDYAKEMEILKLDNRELTESYTELADEVKGYCRETNERVFRACQEGK